MRRPLLAAAAAIVVAGACEVTTQQAPTRQAASEVALQLPDVPPDLQRCAASGSVDSYLRALKAAGGPGWLDLSTAWQKARARGADDGEVVIFTDTPTACLAGLIPPQGRSAASLSLRYPDAPAATRAWEGGILDLPQPAADQQSPGLTQGVATGLGRNSWSFERTAAGRSSYLAFWQNGSFDILVATGGLSSDQSRIAAAAVGGRVR